MKIKHRRALLVVCSVLAFMLLMKFTLLGSAWISELFNRILPPQPGSNINARVHVEVFWRLSFLASVLFACLAIPFLFWDYRPTERKKRIAICALLIVLLPFTCVNFASGDSLMRREAQLLLDVVIVFLGITVLLQLRDLRYSSPAALSLQTLLIFSVLLLSVAIPALYATVWILDWQGLKLPNVVGQQISLVAALISFGSSVLFFRQRLTAKSDAKAE